MRAIFLGVFFVFDAWGPPRRSPLGPRTGRCTFTTLPKRIRSSFFLFLRATFFPTLRYQIHAGVYYSTLAQAFCHLIRSPSFLFLFSFTFFLPLWFSTLFEVRGRPRSSALLYVVDTLPTSPIFFCSPFPPPTSFFPVSNSFFPDYLFSVRLSPLFLFFPLSTRSVSLIGTRQRPQSPLFPAQEITELSIPSSYACLLYLSFRSTIPVFAGHARHFSNYPHTLVAGSVERRAD